jgi:FemAB-related protein (PEP-CTERM system-associated)
MNVIPIGEGDEARRWDAYVEPRASAVMDLSAWRRVVDRAYGMKSWLLAAVEGDRWLGALSLFEARHPLFGSYLATSAFGNDGGITFDTDAARDALLAAAKALADERKVEYLVLRTRELDLPGFTVDGHYRSAILDLTGGADTVWKDRIPAKTRNQVRKGQKENFTISTGHDQLDAFYQVFHEHMRDLGSPAHSRRYYETIVEELGDRMTFLVVRDGDELAAGALLFWTNGTAMNLHTVALRKFNSRCPNYLIYWTMIEAACARGCTRFDMGRSEADSNNIKFKANWGTTVSTLHYNYYLRTLKEIPYLDPRNPKYRIPMLVWQKMPLFMTKQVGPRLIYGLL